MERRRRAGRGSSHSGAAAMMLLCLVTGCAVRADRADLPRMGQLPADAPRLLVTLDLNPPAPLPSAGSSSRPYAGAGRYVTSARMRRLTEALARDFRLVPMDEWPIEVLGVHCIVLALPRPAELDRTLERLRADPRVESAQPVQRFTTLSNRYDDPYSGMQHVLDAMRIRQSHDWADGTGVRVAVVDTGVDRRHVDIAGRLRMVRDFVGDGNRRVPAERHGTAVAGVIASAANNGVGTVGIAPRAEILALRACWERREGASGECDSYTLAKALAFVVERRPDVLNLSLAGPPDPLLERLVQAALKAGVIVIGAHDTTQASFPGSVEGVIVVRAGAGRRFSRRGAGGVERLGRCSGARCTGGAPRRSVRFRLRQFVRHGACERGRCAGAAGRSESRRRGVRRVAERESLSG